MLNSRVTYITVSSPKRRNRYHSDGSLRSVNDDIMKKAAVIVIAAAMIASFLIPSVLYFIVETELIVSIVVFIIMIVLSVAMAFVAKERIDEINRGQDNDSDNY